MKKILAVIMVIIALLSLSACTDNSRERLKEICKKYSQKYTSTKIESENKYKIEIKSPDFNKISEIIVEDSNSSEIDVDRIEDEIENHPEYQKSYTFEVDDCSQDKIDSGYYNQISKELIVKAISNVKFEEEWEAKDEENN